MRKAAIAATLAVALAVLPLGERAQAVHGRRSQLALDANAVGGSLLARHVSVRGGWAWRSAIQAPHLQTDRDVGAAGIAMGLLALADYTHERRYLGAARRAGDWLLAVAQRSRGGLSWPDYRDPNMRSDDHFSSFDDGTPGIADLLWRLGVTTRDRRYTRAALAGMRWMETDARGVGRVRCPPLCRFPYYEDPNDFRTGMGEGNAGVAYAFDVFAQRTGSRAFERYALGTASYLERLLRAHGAIPERPGVHGFDTGFLSGSAGDAFLFLRLYRHTRDARWLRDAERLLAWVRARALPQRDGLAWPIEVGREADPQLATGFEEGAAGIGWVEIQAWRVTGRRDHLDTARAAGDWLLSVAESQPAGGSAWPEDVGGRLIHTSLNNGAPGIGWFLHDLFLATGDARYERGATQAATWLEGVARRDARGVYWGENLSPRGWSIFRDPSWHWGSAGIAAFLARLGGGKLDMPGEEPAL